jgi:hypothetical protein
VGDIEANTDTPACWSSSNACQRVIVDEDIDKAELTNIS